MVQPSYPRDLDRGLESLYYTLRTSHSRTQQPPAYSSRATEPSRKQSPGDSGAVFLQRTPPSDVQQRTASGNTAQQHRRTDDQTDRKNQGRNSDISRTRESQNNSSTSLAPLRVVGPMLRVDSEAEAVLRGALPAKKIDERRDGTTERESAEAYRASRRSSRIGSAGLDNGYSGRRTHLESVVPTSTDAGTNSQQSQDRKEGEKLRLARMEQGMGKLGLL